MESADLLTNVITNMPNFLGLTLLSFVLWNIVKMLLDIIKTIIPMTVEIRSIVLEIARKLDIENK